MYINASMMDYLIPKMRYTYTYTSPATLRNPIRWETTIEESGGVTSLIDLARGKSLDEKYKTLFKAPYTQFLKLETDLTKTWSLGLFSKLVGHLNAGILYNYGNCNTAPFTELFYVGGANSIRAFQMRDIGPGRLTFLDGASRQINYVLRNGDFKLVGNLEYRTPLFGNLEGALFLDAGNVWYLRYADLMDESEYTSQEDYQEDREIYEQMGFEPSKFLNDIAVGTGIGLRYNLGFLVIRLDWGVALHLPYDTGKSGYFNIGRFKDAHTLHFAIGYPF